MKPRISDACRHRGPLPQELTALRLDQPGTRDEHRLLPFEPPLLELAVASPWPAARAVRPALDLGERSVETVLQTPPHAVGSQRPGCVVSASELHAPDGK